MTEIPTLTTDRLILRGPVASDFDAYAAFYRTPRSSFAGGPLGLAEAWRFFCTGVGHWALTGFGWWTITENAAPVGTVGLQAAPHKADPEMGWMLFDRAEGRGLAFEAAKAALHWARRTLALPRLVSYIDAGNARSIRLAERLGATPETGRAAHDPACLVFRHISTGDAT